MPLGQCAQAGRFKKKHWGSSDTVTSNLVRCTMTDNRQGRVMEPRASQVAGAGQQVERVTMHPRCAQIAQLSPLSRAGISAPPFTFKTMSGWMISFVVPLRMQRHPTPTPCRFRGLELFLFACGSLLYVYLFLYTYLPPDPAVILSPVLNGDLVTL